MNSSEKTWISHEDGPIKYVEVGNGRTRSQEIGHDAIENTFSRSGEIKQNPNRAKAKKALLGVALAALTTAMLVAAGPEKQPNQRLSRENWEYLMDDSLKNYGDSSAVYGENGSMVEITAGNTHYTFHDTDNDAAMESGSATRAGKTVEFENQDGLSITRGIDDLTGKMNA